MSDTDVSNDINNSEGYGNLIFIRMQHLSPNYMLSRIEFIENGLDSFFIVYDENGDFDVIDLYSTRCNHLLIYNDNDKIINNNIGFHPIKYFDVEHYICMRKTSE